MSVACVTIRLCDGWPRFTRKQGTLRRTVDIARPRDMKFFSRVRASDGFNILERYVPRSAARAADSFCERIFGFADALKEITPA